MAQITWNTKAGNLGAFGENTELKIQFSANNPLAVGVTPTGFDPRTLFGNGQANQVSATMPLDTVNSIHIISRNLPGDALTGDFPNKITAQNIDVTYPYRGGRNESSVYPFPVQEGPIGISSIGVPFFGPNAGVRFAGDNDSVWSLNTVAARIFGEDKYSGNTERNGQYHYRTSEFITFRAWDKIENYVGGSYTHADGHSKLIGWAADGYPIYGPYGYVNPEEAGAAQLMVSGYTHPAEGKVVANRPGATRVLVTKTVRHSSTILANSTVGLYPGMRLRSGMWKDGDVWIVDIYNDQILINAKLNIDSNTELVAFWPQGMFLEDWHYTSPAGTTLDRHNGRFCVTPEFPKGTYAYFATQTIDGKATFPYIIGPTYRGQLTINEPAIKGVADLSGTFVADNLTYTVISGQVPPGTQLYKSTGLLYGYPIVTDAATNAPRRYTFTIRAQNSRNQVSDRTFSVDINNIVPPTLEDTADPVTNVVDLGTFFDSEKISIPLEYTEVNPAATLVWSVTKGTVPLGLTLDQTGTISGFAEAPAAPGPAGSGAWDYGVFDQFVWDYEGATLSKTYQFTVRLYDGVNGVEKKYKMTILAKSFFRADNEDKTGMFTADTDHVHDDMGIVTSRTIFTADKDGFTYPTITTDPASLPAIKQDRSFAFKFDAYFPNPNFNVKWEISNTPEDGFGGANFDTANWDQANLVLPFGLTLDTSTGWLIGNLSATVLQGSRKRFFDFLIRAYVEVEVDINTFDKRYSPAVQFRLNVLSAAENLITWTTPADLGYIDNGRISNLKIEATALDGQALTYTLLSTMKTLQLENSSDQRIVSGVPSRMPQGLSLLSTGLISGRTTFDYYSMDRNAQAEITLDKKSTTMDAVYTFVVQAVTADGYSYGNKTFTLRVRHINQRPFENLYMRSLTVPALRKVFHSVVNDIDLTGVIYRPEDPYFGIPKTLSFLAVPGLKADTPADYIATMSKYHMNKTINFGDIKTAVAEDYNLNTTYEVLYVEVKEPGNPTTNSQPVTRTYNDTTGIAHTVSIESNTFENMKQDMIDGIGYEYQGALPDWMVTMQPDTKKSIGFVRAVVLGYANPGQVNKLKTLFLRSLIRGSFGFNSLFGQFTFTADRYQWDRALSTNYNASTKTFLPSRETTFDISAPVGVIDKGPWLLRDTGTVSDLNSVEYNGSMFTAVGKNNTLLTSRAGQQWSAVSQYVDFGYSASVQRAEDLSTFWFAAGQNFSIGDELLQVYPWNNSVTTYISSLQYYLRISANVANTIPAGTTIEFLDALNQAHTANLVVSAEVGDGNLRVDSYENVTTGMNGYIKGINRRVPAELTGIRSHNLLLGSPTTNVIASGTTVIVDDLRGNVFAFVTDGSTPKANTEIQVLTDLTTVTNLVDHPTEYIPKLGGLEAQLLAEQVRVGVTAPNSVDVQKGAELQFSTRITASSAAGSSTISYSNTERIAVGSSVTSVSQIAGTLAAGGWTSNVDASITGLTITIPTQTVSGKIITNMKVIAPTLPAETRVVRSYTQGSLTYIDVSFPAVSGIYNHGSTVVTNDYYSLTLDKPLAYDLAVGSVLTFNSFGPDVSQQLTVEQKATAGSSVINFTNAPGLSLLNSEVSITGLQSDVIDSTTEPDTDTIIMQDLLVAPIPAGTSLTLFDSVTNGSSTYITRSISDTGFGNIRFTANIPYNLVDGASPVTVKGFEFGTIVSDIDLDNNAIIIDPPATAFIPGQTVIEIATVGHVTLDANVQAGDTSLAITTTPDSGMVTHLVTFPQIDPDTMLASIDNDVLTLDTATLAADLLEGTTVQVTTSNGWANVQLLVTANAVMSDSSFSVNTTPVTHAIDAYASVQNISFGVGATPVVTATSGNLLTVDTSVTQLIPQNTILTVGTTQLTVATDQFVGNTSILMRTPTVGSLEGFVVPLSGNAALTMSTTDLINPGTTVISKTPTSIELSSPLQTDLLLGFDENLTFGVNPGDYNQVRWINDRWVAVGTKAAVISQDNNGNWDQRRAYNYGDLLSIDYGNGYYVAVGTSGLILISNDLETWYVQASNTDANLRSIAYHNGLWIIVGDNGSVQISTDAEIADSTTITQTWYDKTATVWGAYAPHNLYSVKFLSGQWVMVGAAGTVITNVNAQNWLADLVGDTEWTVNSSGTTATLTDITYTAGVYVAVGNNGVLIESNDASSWIQRTSGVTDSLTSAATDGSQVLVAGAYGTLIASSGFFVVDFAVRNVTFEMFNNSTLDQLAVLGYRPKDGQTLVWAQQEGFPTDNFRGKSFENDGWNDYQNTFDYPKFDNAAYEITNETRVIIGNPYPGAANVVVGNTEGISVGNYFNSGVYTTNDNVYVMAVYPQENIVTLSENVTVAMSDKITFVNNVGFDTTGIVPGYLEHQKNSNVLNKRAGVWQVNITNGVVTLQFVRQVLPGQIVMVKNENVKLVYDPVIPPNKLIPQYNILHQELSLPVRTTFDGSGTRFSNNRDQYTEPGALDKYLKFPRIGVFE